MRKTATAAALFVLVAAWPAPAPAQERGQTGVAMGYPASVSIIWHATDRVAVRPEVTFATGSSESTSLFGSTLSYDTTSVGVAASVLFYTTRTDNLSTYFAPRVSYTRNTSESGTSLGETRSSTTSVAGSFGAQYSLHQRFGVFGEVGLSYSDGHLESLPSGSESNSWGLNTRSAVGVILYF